MKTVLNLIDKGCLILKSNILEEERKKEKWLSSAQVRGTRSEQSSLDEKTKENMPHLSGTTFCGNDHFPLSAVVKE